MLNRCTVLIAASVVSACASAAQLPLSAGVGPQPELPPPKTSVLPLVKVATAKGWPAGAKPAAAEGTTVAVFAQGLEHPAPRGRQGHQGKVLQALSEEGGRRGAERQSHHAAP